MRSKLGAVIIAGMAAIQIVCATNSAHAVTFSFFFSNVNGNVAGDVSGRIVLPNGDGTFAASSVLIDMYPAALNLGPTPIDALAFEADSNSFAVTGGQITGANFQSGKPLLIIAEDVEGEAIATLVGDPDTLSVLDADGTTLQFAPVNEVPLPTTLPLFATGLVMLGLLGWRRKRKQIAA